MKKFGLQAGLIMMTSGLAQAAVPQTNAVSSAGSFFQVLMGLIIVLAFMMLVAWLLKRFNLTRVAGNAPVKVIGGVSVGNRERVMVVEVADQWIVVGVATGQVNALSTMPKPELPPASQQAAVPANDFASWLKQKIEKRNAE